MNRVRESLIAVALVFVSTGVGLLLAEAALWVRAGFHASGESATALFKYEDLYVSSRPIAHFDPVSGYRRVEGPMRIVRIVRDEVQFDSTFTPNNKGYTTATNFNERKQNPDATRVIVFGDSFTAGEFLDTPWPDRVNRAISGKTAPPLELYAFAVNGGGVWNWHSIFFNDVVPNYEFDAVMLAIWGDDIARGFSVLHYDEAGQSYAQYLNRRPVDEDDFRGNVLPQMPKHYAKVASHEEIDSMIAAIEAEWRPASVTPRVPRLVREQIRRLGGAKLPPQDGVAPSLPDDPNLAEIATRYGDSQFSKLTEILEYCRARNIPVLIAAVPSRASAEAAAAGRIERAQHQELRIIARHFGALYFDGHVPFTAVAPDDVGTLYWFHYDAHWNQAGSDLFAEAMTSFLIEHAPDLTRRPSAATDLGSFEQRR